MATQRDRGGFNLLAAEMGWPREVGATAGAEGLAAPAEGAAPVQASSGRRGAGVRMPGFFGYCGRAVAFLVPTFILAAFVFFR